MWAVWKEASLELPCPGNNTSLSSGLLRREKVLHSCPGDVMVKQLLQQGLHQPSLASSSSLDTWLQFPCRSASLWPGFSLPKSWSNQNGSLFHYLHPMEWVGIHEIAIDCWGQDHFQTKMSRHNFAFILLLLFRILLIPISDINWGVWDACVVSRPSWNSPLFKSSSTPAQKYTLVCLPCSPPPTLLKITSFEM